MEPAGVYGWGFVPTRFELGGGLVVFVTDR
jgi:hypothetical protein